MLAILVNGLPGAGKTTLARALANELELPLFSKDAVKETLADTMAVLRPAGSTAREWSRALGIAAAETLWTLLADAPVGAVLESPWLAHLRPSRRGGTAARPRLRGARGVVRQRDFPFALGGDVDGQPASGTAAAPARPTPIPGPLPASAATPLRSTRCRPPYVRPQENGARADVRWARLRREDGTGIPVEGEPAFWFTARRWTTDQLDATDHTPGLVPGSGFRPTHLAACGRPTTVGSGRSAVPRRPPLP